MAVLQKRDYADRVTYTVVADSTAVPPVPNYEITIYKCGHLHQVIVADWGSAYSGQHADWQSFTASIETGNTVTPA